MISCDQALSEKIESVMVEKNLRGMKDASAWLKPGYILRAAQTINNCNGTVFIGTGFPVADTYETDGPIGCITLYHALSALGKSPIIVCDDPLYSALEKDFNCLHLPITSINDDDESIVEILNKFNPQAIISIERPGKDSQGNYRNMRGELISERCGNFDRFLDLASCPTIAIGDGGNEIGMGNIAEKLVEFDIHVSQTTCNELIVADVSNWGSYGLITFLSRWNNKNLLAEIELKPLFEYLSARGSVDGVTRKNTLTEDSLCFSEGAKLINELQALSGLTSEFNTL